MQIYNKNVIASRCEVMNDCTVEAEADFTVESSKSVYEGLHSVCKHNMQV